MKLFDIGANLTNSDFDQDLEDVLQRATDQNVAGMLITGTTLKDSETAIHYCQQYPEANLWSTAGVHPHYSKDFSANQLEQLSALAKDPYVLAIGETGLDFNRDFSPRDAQEESFLLHLEVGSATDKPLFLHEREAFERQHDILRHHRNDFTCGVVHCFTGDKKALYAYLDLDLYIGITGWVCDERRGLELQRLVKDIPADRLLLETDAPYLLPRDIKPRPKSRRNEPLYMKHIAQVVARLRDIEVNELTDQVWENTKRLFGQKIDHSYKSELEKQVT
ncbi:TatD family hydrolase [Pokkaliibacter sp. CJK22405]|uniref:TatD family hydrolase n=1 Tax=Pokkaliibacter sp. CJK22405 TaxID=3384615 RepID=UPI00398471AF